MKKIIISEQVLRRVLEALDGPPHLIRELQATRGPLVGDDNPINLLIKEYNKQMSEPREDPVAEVRLACGRQYLKVAGMIVVVEGDICRDPGIPEEYRHPQEEHHLRWIPEMLEYVAKTINEKVG